eukprot:59598-Rhodomonas_salina.1
MSVPDLTPRMRRATSAMDGTKQLKALSQERQVAQHRLHQIPSATGQNMPGRTIKSQVSSGKQIALAEGHCTYLGSSMRTYGPANSHIPPRPGSAASYRMSAATRWAASILWRGAELAGPGKHRLQVSPEHRPQHTAQSLVEEHTRTDVEVECRRAVAGVCERPTKLSAQSPQMQEKSPCMALLPALSSTDLRGDDLGRWWK